jgi:predicted O-methyltransferase YrrM
LKYAVCSLPCGPDQSLQYSSKLVTVLHHPLYAWLGLRPVVGQHSAAEHEALNRWARGRTTLVEIGVAEGVSAMALRAAMAPESTLYLIDPFHLSRLPLLNFTRRAAHKAVASYPQGRVVWLEKFSQEVAAGWQEPIDLLLIDGDHSESGVRRDWNDWNRFVRPGGVVIFHDARVFDGGWAGPEWGPVRLLNELFRESPVPEWTIVEEVHSLVIVERGRA